MSANTIRMGKAFIELDAKTSPFKRAMDNASKNVMAFGSKVQATSSAMAGAFQSVSPSIAAIAPSISLVSLALEGVVRGIGNIASAVQAASTATLFFGALAAAVATYFVLKKMVDNYERKQAEQRLREAEKATSRNKETSDLHAKQLQYLETLAKKESLTNEEREKTARIVDEITSRYGDLGIEIDKTTGKARGLAEAIRKQKIAALIKERSDLGRENVRLKISADMAEDRGKGRWTWVYGGSEKRRKDFEERDEAWSKYRRNKIRQEEINLELLNMELETDEKSVEVKSRILESEKELADLRAKYAQTKESEYQREMRQLDEEFKKRRRLAGVIVAELEAKKELTEEERRKLQAARDEMDEVSWSKNGLVAIKEGGEYEQRANEINKRRNALTSRYRNAADDQLAKEAEERAKQEDRKRWERLKDTSPEAALAQAEEKKNAQQTALDAAVAAYDALYESAMKDRELVDTEKEQLDKQLKEIADLSKSVQEWAGLADGIKVGALQEQTRAISAGTGAAPDALSMNSVETFKKIYEYQMRQLNPVLESNRLLNQIYREQVNMNGNLKGV